jgi:hypothetical protein
MRPRVIGTLLLVVALIPGVGIAGEGPAPPSIVVAGLAAYKAEGTQAALRAWLKGGPLETSKEAMAQANMLNQIQEFYGKYESYECMEVKDLSSRSQLSYVIMHYENGALFAMFLTYKAKTAVTLSNMQFNTEPWKLWPTEMLH